ncbi:MAG: DGQHR domain-containing protein [Myxococcales bacterium]|nr:DGQHR domain-containing protein [Myxococcales bacterium]
MRRSILPRAFPSFPRGDRTPPKGGRGKNYLERHIRTNRGANRYEVFANILTEATVSASCLREQWPCFLLARSSTPGGASMSIVVPCIRGKMGNTEFYEATMPARELVTGVRPASELDEWANLGIEERMQREPNTKRILEDIAPYIARSEDRFFGSVIVLVYKGDIVFESLKDLGAKIPHAYKSAGDRIGWVTIDGGALIVLDGQHRLLALEKVIKNEVGGPCAMQVPMDDVSVIFIRHEGNEKTRRIFNKVNRYAKPTSRGDNIITSEDDAYAIVARWMLSEGAPLGLRDGSEPIVNWKSNTLAPRSTKFTTISAVYETIKSILDAHGLAVDTRYRPNEEQLEQCREYSEHFWRAVLEGLDPYKQALTDVKRLPDMRQDTAPSALLFKPAAQIALFDGLALATSHYGVDIKEAVRRANAIDWKMSSPFWRNVLVRPDGTIDVRGEARQLSGKLIAYMIAGDKMPAPEREQLLAASNNARGVHESALPTPVASRAAIEDAEEVSAS